MCLAVIWTRDAGGRIGTVAVGLLVALRARVSDTAPSFQAHTHLAG